MKKPVHRRSEDLLRDHPITNIIDGWYFRVDELSQGYFHVEGVDLWGRIVSRDGIDPEELLLACRDDILEMFSE